MNVIQALNEASSKRKQIQEEAAAAVKAVLAPGLNLFMREHPEVKAIGWTQYTPYFNDGEPCVFNFHGLHASMEEERGDSLYDEGWAEIYGKKADDGWTQQTWDDLVALAKALSDADEDLEAAFGDHVQVIVTPEGVDVEEYSHD
jgi:hypothetical protein